VCATWLVHLILIDFLSVFGGQYKLRSFAWTPVTSSLYMQFSSQTRSICFLPWMWEIKFHPLTK
jgi:hypothetical protein